MVADGDSLGRVNTSQELIERALALAGADKATLEPNQRISINWEAQTVATTAIAAAIGELAGSVTALGIMVGDLAEAATAPKR